MDRTDNLSGAALPMRSAPHDDLRFGLSSLKDEASTAHPVEALERNHSRQQWASKEQMMRNVYGSSLPARQQIERQILSRVQRLPGLPSSRLGLESLTGELDDFDFSSYIAAFDDSETTPPSMHDVMEARLGMAAEAPKRELP